MMPINRFKELQLLNVPRNCPLLLCNLTNLLLNTQKSTINPRLSQFNLVYILTPYFYKINLVSFLSWCFQLSLSLRHFY